MDFDFDKAVDKVGEGLKGTADKAVDVAKDVNKKYVSKVTPNLGKYGDVAKMGAEMVPGVSEYNALVAGDLKAAAIAAGVDVAAVAAGALTGGAGAVGVKGAAAVGKAGLKAGAREAVESSVKKAAEEGAEKATKGTVENTIKTGGDKVVEEHLIKNSDDVKNSVAKTLDKDTKESTTNSDRTSVAEKRGRVEVGTKMKTELVPEYLKEIETITKLKISDVQRKALLQDLKNGEFAKLGPEGVVASSKKFTKLRDTMIADWEKHTGQTWPTYAEDVLSADGKIIHKAGDRYDAHHIIEKSFGGPNSWENIHPAAGPLEHQQGIHLGVAKEVFGG
jgi:hypothetical protein